MYRWLPVFALLLRVPGTAAAQTPRDEAIRLLLAGDYQRAAQGGYRRAVDRAPGALTWG